jgi:hypothetical protein
MNKKKNYIIITVLLCIFINNYNTFYYEFGKKKVKQLVRIRIHTTEHTILIEFDVLQYARWKWKEV